MLQDQINALESRQLELQATMASTDAHAAKCVKLGKKFSTQYPEEAAGYQAANDEYNANEVTLAALRDQLAAEEAAAEEADHIEE